MNSEIVRCDDIYLVHKSDTTQNTPIKIFAHSGIGTDHPIHLKTFFIDDKFKIIVENDELIIQKKISGNFRNYFILS